MNYSLEGLRQRRLDQKHHSKATGGSAQVPTFAWSPPVLIINMVKHKLDIDLQIYKSDSETNI